MDDIQKQLKFISLQIEKIRRGLICLEAETNEKLLEIINLINSSSAGQ